MDGMLRIKFLIIFALTTSFTNIVCADYEDIDLDDESTENMNEVIDVVHETDLFLNHGEAPTVNVPALDGLKLENSVTKSKVDLLSGVFKKNIDKLKSKHKKLDIVFLVDASSSIGKLNFESELKFVKKLLSDFSVSYEYTRVAIVTFSSQGKIIRHVDQISKPSQINDKCSLLNHEVTKIEFTGGGTHTFGAFQEAKDIFKHARFGSKKLIFLITDGYSNGPDPVPLANELKMDNITIYTIGVQSGNYAELYNISSSPGELHSYLLDSFGQFESLARKALHADYKVGEMLRAQSPKFCNVLCKEQMNDEDSNVQSCCDKNAYCSCETNSGHYTCLCEPGYFGSGLNNSCQACANGTYWETWNVCKSCPDKNHITLKEPALSGTDCICKVGFKAGERNNCEPITCPELIPPKNGYFVTSPSGCRQVLNAACGVRCKSGYQLTGSSIRLCQENGTWSGEEAECVLKTCPALQVPYYGSTICRNPDLNLFFDYSTRNATFMQNYSRDIEKFTEPMPIDTECTFKCGHGFYIVGSRKRNCLPLKEGKWDGLQTSCKQILCPALPKVKFGTYEPLDCTEDKSEHGSNCTLICDFGFELKGGPSTKVCNGKKNGYWSHKNKTPRCVDITPPQLICPSDYSLPLHQDYNYTVVKELHRPYVFDNSGENVTCWTRPAIKENGVKLGVGNHTFTFVAVDNFKNKEKCNVTLTIVDINPPVFEDCVSPPVLYIGAEKNLNTTYLEWDEPFVYDNSFETVSLEKSLDFGYLDVGIHEVTYTATDTSGNINECVVNVTVEQRQCETIQSPSNGQSICVRNVTHTWCEVACDIGYGIYQNEQELQDSLRLICENREGNWPSKPECSKIEIPESVEEVFTISLDSDPLICDDMEAQNNVKNDLMKTIRQHMCQDQESCEITSELPTCAVSNEKESRSQIEHHINDSTFYNIVKREVPGQTKRDSKANVQIRVYTNIGKRLGLWQYNTTKAENIQRIQAELQQLPSNEELKQKLVKYKIDIAGLKLDELVRCSNGSVSKKLICVQCPRGTFHNTATNQCESCPIGTYNNVQGSTACYSCPPYHTTRKSNSRSYNECKALCPPGTIAKQKFRIGQNAYQNSLMPYCKKCGPAEYNSHYNQHICQKCPPGYISPRGSISSFNCTQRIMPCYSFPSICGPYGKCTPEVNDLYLYSCTCDDGYMGAHCEIRQNNCASAPCFNGGICRWRNTTIDCLCPNPYFGQFCEFFRDPCGKNPCRNGGTCVVVNDNAICECANGFEGENCEIRKNFCQSSPCVIGNCVSTVEDFVCVCPAGTIGRRCHLKPCDYLPCQGSAICVDKHDNVTTKDSYSCECPTGLKGQNCTEIDNPCDKAPCKNNGLCTPIALRDPAAKSVFSRYLNDNRYTEYKCDCPPFFYGKSCETLITPDFIMEFQKTNVNNYIKMDGPQQNLQEISFCVWLQTSDSFNYGTIISYAVEGTDNMFTLTDYNGFVLYVNSSNTITDIIINDGYWHFVCVTWRKENGYFEIYLNGQLVSSGVGLNPNGEIQGNGVLIIGQEQDSLGSSFSESESFVGKIAYLDIWKRSLNGYEVQELYTSCEPYQGDLYAWTDFKLKAHGNIKIYPSNFCKPCTQNLTIVNGNVAYLGNNALYQCDEGYKMKGSSMRNCLRTSDWEREYPSCKLIRCGYVGSVTNGKVAVTKSSYGGVATFECENGYDMIGINKRVCELNGKWSGENPECASKSYCQPIKVPKHSTVVYATEKGIISGNITELRTGTLAEIQCEDGKYPSSENLITCQNDGKWDNDPPECIIDLNYIETTTVTTMSSVASTEYVTMPSESTETVQYPDKSFWKSLHAFLFFGCSNVELKKRSKMCDHYAFNVSNLSHLGSGEIQNIQNTDQKLIGFIQKALSSEKFSNITLGNLFNFILYQSNEPNKGDRMELGRENSYRLTLCFYVNNISSDRLIPVNAEFNSKSDSNDVGEQIKQSIRKLVQPAYDKYIKLLDEEKVPPTSAPINAILAMIAARDSDDS